MDEGYKRDFLDVLSSVMMERRKAIEKHGNNNYPDGTKDELVAMLEVVEKMCSKHTKAGTVTWAEVLTEEVLEALTEKDDRQLEKELLQVSAVAAAWVLCIRRRRQWVEENKPSSSKTRRQLSGLPSPYKEAE